MKINTNLKALGVAATMLTGFVLGGSATAFAEGEENKGHGGAYTSNTIIQFKQNDGEGSVTPPVDPTDPGNPDPVDPVDPTGPTKPGTPGPLSIDYASSLDFGTQDITSANKTYYAKAQKFGKRGDGPNYVQVSDTRGTDAGWSLQVKQDGQFKTETGKELAGAEITFKNAWVNTASESPIPSISKKTFSLKPEGNGVVEDIMTAKVGEGNGTYVLVFGEDQTAADSIELFVPGKTTKYAGEQYSTSLTWTLTDTPGKDAGSETEPETETQQ
ncbi:cell surface protein [Lysinibacillus sp. KCTC 33748]|uniref:WxL domain-containing protein n=1 Tax=unclassified Lysinibacillus TaxID=2636778 RepID=UPI0009A58A16|nr:MULTISPECIES: WxL domain-containing protein [unclassified Lysinibacillus]OXS66993.1 cell surface protein [Lysinibacillus sp. KCTC 33748]SKC16243.1 WxL domain surface cell wall-binding [Lysinibacillus sp. AC-3]